MKRLVQLGLMVTTLLFAGCGSPVAEREYPIAITSPEIKARGLLERYAEGAPVASEITSFNTIIADLLETDGDLAAHVEAAFKDLKSNPSNAKSIAKKALSEFPDKP